MTAIPPNPKHSPDVDMANVHNQRSMIMSILTSFLEEDRVADLGGWIDHVGFDLTVIRHPADLPAAWIAHYRSGCGYDVQRALKDLLSWPPIAERIAFLSRQHAVDGQPTPSTENLPVDLGNLTNDL